jgi:hypothetical protein
MADQLKKDSDELSDKVWTAKEAKKNRPPVTVIKEE